MIGECACGRIAIGLEVTSVRNWNPDCLEHGVESTWWNSEKQVSLRARRSAELAGLWQAARAVRRREGE